MRALRWNRWKYLGLLAATGLAACGGGDGDAPEETRAQDSRSFAPANPSATSFDALAAASGLQWVGSDADKVAAAQAAIAAEPQPERVVRERPPVVALDDGPLILVETRKDLSELQLPFEQQPQPQGAAQV